VNAERDKNTLGLTSDGQDDLTELVNTEWFEAEMDVYRLAVAVALGRDLDVSAEPLRGVETKWNVGSLDRDGQLKELIQASAPEVSRPYEYSERLAEVGLRYLREGLVTARQTLSSVITSAEASEAEGDSDDEAPGEA
jgi:hypothetical protein